MTLVIHAPLLGSQPGMPALGVCRLAGAAQPPARLARGNPMQAWGLGGGPSSQASRRSRSVLEPGCTAGRHPALLGSAAFCSAAGPCLVLGCQGPWEVALRLDRRQASLGRGEYEKGDGVLCLREVHDFRGPVRDRRRVSGCSWVLRGGLGQRGPRPWWQGQRGPRPWWQGQRPTQALCRCLPVGADLLASLKLYFVRNPDA